MTSVKKVFQFGWIAALGVLILTSCSGGDDRDAKTATSALIQENTNIVGFGHLSVQQLLDKLDYKNLPKVNAIVGGELRSWEGGIDLSKPIYFAVQAPFGHDGAPESSYVLMDVKNKDSLIAKFSEMGYASEKAGEIECFREGDVAVGVRNNLAIVVIKGGEYDYKKKLEDTFKATEGDESEGKTQTILESKGDLVAGMNIERLFTTSNTSLSKLDEAKQQELRDLVADGFVHTTMSFDKGQLTVKSSNLFSEALKNKLFFKEDPSASILRKLGTGDAWMGVSANIDTRKIETFLSDYAPDAEAEMNAKMPGEASMMLAMIGENPIAKLLSGQFGFVAVGNPKSEAGMVPQFNFFLGLGSKGDFISDKVRDYASLMQMEQQGDAFVTEGVAIRATKDGIYGYTTASGNSSTLKIPAFAKDFGKKTFTMFVDFSKVDVKSLELRDGMEVLEIMDSFVVNVDRNGGEMILTSKDKSSNILKQMGAYYTKMMEERMGGMAI